MTTARDVCMVFADVCGSTQLYEKLGDAAALSAVDLCVGTMTRATLLNRGRVVKTLGDEVMAAFDSAAQGMQAAIEMQQRIDAMPAPAPGVKLAIRVGFCYGPALFDNDDIFGDTVNTAARMAGLAKAGQIITTAATVAVLPKLLQPSCRAIDAWAVKGKSANVNICEVIWQEDVDLTMMSARMTPAAPTHLHLKLRHAGNELILSPARPRIMLGREAACDIVIRDARASRSHARIECRRDKFVLVDLSSNGTFVTVQGEVEFSLRREEAILRGAGRIVFGHAWSALAATETLEYAVES